MNKASAFRIKQSDGTYGDPIVFGLDKSEVWSSTQEILANEDLNDYDGSVAGFYRCGANNIAATLTNCPTNKAFSLQVFKTTDSYNGCLQILMPFSIGDDDENTGRIWIRPYYNNEWVAWHQVVTSLDRPIEYTSVGWTTASTVDAHKWHKVATFTNTYNNNDRRAIFTVTDSFWRDGVSEVQRPDLKYGILHVHIRKVVGSAGVARFLTWNLNTGYNLDDFLLIYNPVDDVDELWTKITTDYNIRTFNLIENGMLTGGNRHKQLSRNPIIMYGRTANSEGVADYPTGEGYIVTPSVCSDILQTARGIREDGFDYYAGTNTRRTSANNLPVGKGLMKYFNSTSSMSVANGKPVHIKTNSGMDAHVLHLPWDGTNGYDSQLAIPCSTNVSDSDSAKTLQWRAGSGQTATLEDGTKVQTGWTDWIHLIDDQFSFDGVRPGYRRVTHYGVCSTAAATAVKVVDIPHFELVTGAYVIVTFTETNSAAVANLKLNVSNTGDIPIKYHNGNVAAAGDLIADRPFLFVYDGTNWQLGIDIDKNTNTNYYERLRTYYPIKAKSAITKQHVIVAGEDGLYFMLTSGSPFSIKYPPLYATSAISANAKSKNAYYFCFLDAAVITNEAAETLTLNKSLYIKGHLNGTTFTPFATKSLVCTEPTTEDGYQYLRLGVVKAADNDSDELRAQIEMEHPIYEYVNGLFRPYHTAFATNADIDAMF